MTTPIPGLLVMAGLLLAGSLPTRALVFQEHTDPDGNHVLVVRDCPASVTDLGASDGATCRTKDGDIFDGPHPGYAGDAAVLDYILNLSESRNSGSPPQGATSGPVTAQTIRSLQQSHQPFAEVWLNSGGGDVEAGVGVARTLRKHGMAVRVPANYQCVSSCSIAFMGGVLRYMNEGGRYRVHSASFYLESENEDLQPIVDKPEEGLIVTAFRNLVDARFMALRLMTTFQNTLLLTVRGQPRPEDDAEFCKWAGGKWTYIDRAARYVCRPLPADPPGPHFSYLDDKCRQRDEDVARIRREGVGAVQDILMRIERDAMTLAISDLESSLPQRGPRARPALNMLRAMYMTSIKDTSYLTSNEMITMGYLTPLFHETK